MGFNSGLKGLNMLFENTGLIPLFWHDYEISILEDENIMLSLYRLGLMSEGNININQCQPFILKNKPGMKLAEDLLKADVPMRKAV
jgi:hypothetical protein